ncbi:hypothetical protein [Paracoccus hibiscisoli]|uniref:Uncharacterized protein n=1 Tax=Paracoccus hibiscisoli TaxID=2023261 RepID=A0A4U0QWB3_9RHOB|nr:hypothetical protein [Paracoccus hibiscisoli]TJZ86070.1 hypothetical protein FA740_04015 [Paracoccus hibiscisoli]
MNILFEEKRRSIETAMVRDDVMNDESYRDRAVADMAAALRAQAEMLARQLASPRPDLLAVLPLEPAARASSTVAPPLVGEALTGIAGTSRIDDPQFERAVLKMADREGW